MTGERAWKGLAVALAALAAAATLHVWLSAPRHREILARKEADLTKIRTFAGRWAAEDALRADWDRRQVAQPADLAELAVNALGAGAARISPRSPVSAAGGWQRREVAVELPSVAYVEAAGFLAAAAASEPPWRLREIDVRPAAEPGRGALSLVLETLEKKTPRR